MNDEPEPDVVVGPPADCCPDPACWIWVVTESPDDWNFRHLSGYVEIDGERFPVTLVDPEGRP